MNLPEAKSVLVQMIVYQYSAHQSKEGDAVKLGLHAITAVENLRDGNPLLDGELLPGETDE